MTTETRRRELLPLALKLLLMCMMSALVGCSGSGGSGPTQRLERDDRGDAVSMTVGSDAIGNALAVWYQDDGDGADVYARRKPLGRGWGKRVQISRRGPYAHDPSVSLSGSRYGNLAVNGAGQAVAVWNQIMRDDRGSRWKLMASVYRPGEGWDVPTMIPSPRSVSEYQADVALNDRGEAIVAFRSTTSFQAKACLFSIEGGWGDCQELQTDPEERSPFVRADINEQGMAVVAWHVFGPGISQFRVTRYTPESGWGARRIVSSLDGVYGGNVALDDDGLALVTWKDSRSGSDQLYVCEFENGSLYGTTALTVDGTGSSAPEVAFGAPGEASILWVEPNGARADVRASFRTPSGYTAPVVIDVADETDARSHSERLAMNEAGEVVATWARGADDDHQAMWSARYVPDVGWEEPVQLDDGKRAYVFPAGLSLDELGNAVALWGEFAESGRLDLWASVF